MGCFFAHNSLVISKLKLLIWISHTLKTITIQGRNSPFPATNSATTFATTKVAVTPFNKGGLHTTSKKLS